MVSARIPVHGGDLHAEIIVDESAPARATVLFLHGWTLDRRMWAPQLEALAPPYRLIGIDRRGFGRSTAPADLSAEADDVLKTLDFLEIGRAFIVGMSQSGRVAAEFALRRPDRVAGLVLQGARIGASRNSTPDDEIPLNEFSALCRAGRLSEMKPKWRAHPLMQVANSESANLLDLILADYDGRDMIVPNARSAELDASAVAGISRPTLVITGEKDTNQRRAIADAQARLIADAKRVEIGNAGHICNICASEEYNRILVDFIEENLGALAD